MILLLACLFVLACYKWGDCKNWRLYYPTMLFLIAGDFLYLYVSSAKPLWQYTAKIFLTGTLSTLIIVLIIYPCTVLLFIPIYNKLRSWRKVVYIVIWVGLYFVLEFIGLKYNYMQHLNGWNLGYSLIFDCLIFPLLIIHQKFAPAAWLMAAIIGVSITLYFKLPAAY
ncbi:MAG: CBO0543 family protein [Desulfosporosinus sp.]|jgi:hypothetical protein